MGGIRKISWNFKAAGNHHAGDGHNISEQIHEARKPCVPDLSFFAFRACHFIFFHFEMRLASGSPLLHCAGLFLPSLKIHAPYQEPQTKREFRNAARQENVGVQIVLQRR